MRLGTESVFFDGWEAELVAQTYELRLRAMKYKYIIYGFILGTLASVALLLFVTQQPCKDYPLEFQGPVKPCETIAGVSPFGQ